MKRTQATPTASTDTVPPDLFVALRQMLQELQALVDQGAARYAAEGRL